MRAEQEQAERWKARSAALKAEKEEARRYNEELQRRADESAARRSAQEESQRQAEQQARIAAQNSSEEAAIAYATRIGGLVGGAAGLEYQLNQMIADAKRYQDIADYSTDWNEQVRALQKAQALIQSIPQIKSEYYDAENTLISLRVRDGQLFDDAMRATIATPEVDPIIRAYCRRLIGE